MEHTLVVSLLVVAYLLFAFVTAVSPVSLVFSVPGILLCLFFGPQLVEGRLNTFDEAGSIILVLVGVALIARAIHGAWDDFSKDYEHRQIETRRQVIQIRMMNEAHWTHKVRALLFLYGEVLRKLDRK